MRKLFLTVVVMAAIALQGPSASSLSNTSSVVTSNQEGAGLRGRSSHLSYVYKNWQETERRLQARGFTTIVANTCYSLNDSPEPLLEYIPVKFTWNCEPVHVSYCHTQIFSGHVTCNQTYLTNGKVFIYSPSNRGKNPFRVFKSTIPLLTDGIWRLNTEEQCEIWGKNLRCPGRERGELIQTCAENNHVPESRTIASGRLKHKWSNGNHETFLLLDTGTDTGITAIHVRPQSPAFEQLKSLDEKRVEIILQTEDSNPNPQQPGVVQQGKVFLVKHGDTVGIQDLQVEVGSAKICDSALLPFHNKNAVLVITPQPTGSN